MFAFTANDRWSPGIGDPTPMGWLTVVVYIGVACLCGIASWKSRVNIAPPGRPWFWGFFALSLVLLGINKQLDLQTWLTLSLRHVAIATGWYHDRRALQAAFIAVVAISGVAGIIGLKRLAGKTTRPIRAALSGGVFLGCFILVRASSFHHVDRMLGMHLGSLKVNWLLELGSLFCIGLAAWMDSHQRPPAPSQRADGQDFIWVSAGDRIKTRHE